MFRHILAPAASFGSRPTDHAAGAARQNNLSNHLARLREAGLVRASRHKVDARWVYYERDEAALAAASRALARIHA